MLFYVSLIGFLKSQWILKWLAPAVVILAVPDKAWNKTT